MLKKKIVSNLSMFKPSLNFYNTHLKLTYDVYIEIAACTLNVQSMECFSFKLMIVHVFNIVLFE